MKFFVKTARRSLYIALIAFACGCRLRIRNDCNDIDEVSLHCCRVNLSDYQDDENCNEMAQTGVPCQFNGNDVFDAFDVEFRAQTRATVDVRCTRAGDTFFHEVLFNIAGAIDQPADGFSCHFSQTIILETGAEPSLAVAINPGDWCATIRLFNFQYRE